MHRLLTGCAVRMPERCTYHITVGELKKGIIKRGGDKRAQDLERWLNGDILLRFSDRILPVDKAVSLEWGASAAKGSALDIRVRR